MYKRCILLNKLKYSWMQNFYHFSSSSNMSNADLEVEWSFYSGILWPPSVRINYFPQISLGFFAFFCRSIHCANFLRCLAATKQWKAPLCVASSLKGFTIEHKPQCSANNWRIIVRTLRSSQYLTFMMVLPYVHRSILRLWWYYLTCIVIVRLLS